MAGPELNHSKHSIVNDFLAVHNDGLLIPVRYAAINVTTSGDTQIVTGTTEKRIYVLGFWLTSGADTTLKWKSGSTDITGAFTIKAGGGAAPDNEHGLFASNASEHLYLNSSAVATIGGSVTYVVI